jgi:carboxyl-terminal processing protease
MNGRTERSCTFIVRVVFSLVALLISCGPTTGSIGAMLGKHNTTGQVTVHAVPQHMEASEAGLLPGDHILLIDGKYVRSMTAEEVHDALVGPIGSKVALTVERDGQILRLDVRRGRLRSGSKPSD